MLSVKQGGIKYYFLNLLYDSTCDWTSVSRTVGEHWAIQWKEKRPSLHFGVVAIEKGAFGSPSTTVANFTYFIGYLKHVTLRKQMTIIKYR